MVGHKPRLTDFVVAPLKVAVLAALPLLAGIEIGNRAAAGSGISGSTEPAGAIAPDVDRAFDDALAQGYRSLAGSLENTSRGASPNDWADAQYFALKAMAAERGENDGPESTRYWSLSPQVRSEIEDMRLRVAAAVDRMSETPNNLPAAQAAARAQVSFDCWIERAEEIDDEQAGVECRDALEAALGDFDTATAGEGIAAATHSAGP